jgi:nicotinate-nucleotide adenylyltransferase
MLTGLFFGSFNPVHIGHLALANYLLIEAGLKEVWFVVSPHNPLKQRQGLLDEKQRLHMVNLAIGEDTRMKTSNIEFGMQQPNYTIHTLVRLEEKYPEKEFVLIMGSDNLESLHKWKNYEQILKNYKICVYPRPGFDGGALRLHGNVQMTQAPLIEISSTQIREAVRMKKDVRHYMPSASWNYLREMHFYEKF